MAMKACQSDPSDGFSKGCKTSTHASSQRQLIAASSRNTTLELLFPGDIGEKRWDERSMIIDPGAKQAEVRAGE